MTGQRLATVGDTIKVRLAPVEGHVKPDWHPEIAGSTQQETGQQSKRPGVKQSDQPRASTKELSVSVRRK